VSPFAELSADGARRQARLVDARLAVVTDSRRDGGDLDQFLRACCEASADLLLLRDKTATEDELRAASAVFRDVCDDFGALFVLNDLPGLATSVGADGVHVGLGDVLPDHARRIVGADLLVGRSARSGRHVDAAGDEDVDYLTVGPVWHEVSSSDEGGVGLDPVTYASRHAAHPWFAAGGITRERAPAVLDAGARRLSVGHEVADAAEPGPVLWDLRRLVAAHH